MKIRASDVDIRVAATDSVELQAKIQGVVNERRYDSFVTLVDIQLAVASREAADIYVATLTFNTIS